MKKIVFIVVALLFSSTIAFGQSLKKDRMIYAWKNMKNMAVNSAKAMPEEHYDLVPAEGLRSYKDQVKHITTSNRFFISYLNGNPNTVKEANDKTLKEVDGKQAIVKDLEQSFDYVISTLESMTGFEDQINMFGQNVSKMEGLMLMEHHLHREQGKITIYMRLKGVAPAKSTSWLL